MIESVAWSRQMKAETEGKETFKCPWCDGTMRWWFKSKEEYEKSRPYKRWMKCDDCGKQMEC